MPWRWRENINVAEARARDLAIRLRARKRSCQRQRYLHLMDSQVNLACIAEGRTGSRRVGHVMRRASATLLATGLHEVVAYVRSDRNPADRASRDRHRWARHRRNLVIKKAVSTRSREGRVIDAPWHLRCHRRPGRNLRRRGLRLIAGNVLKRRGSGALRPPRLCGPPRARRLDAWRRLHELPSACRQGACATSS